MKEGRSEREEKGKERGRGRGIEGRERERNATVAGRGRTRGTSSSPELFYSSPSCSGTVNGRWTEWPKSNKQKKSNRPANALHGDPR